MKKSIAKNVSKCVFSAATVIGLLLTVAAGEAQADTCTVGDTKYYCDFVCRPNGFCLNPTFDFCDGRRHPSGHLKAVNDGKCVICGNKKANTILGSDGDDVLCGKLGDDELISDGRGNDILSGGAGNDEVSVDASGNRLPGRTTGHHRLYGGPGDDTLFGGPGNDVVYGEDGNDLIKGGGGRDYLDGGAGNDDVTAKCDSAMGSLVCGGDGNDVLEASGPGHQCVDGGTGYDSCTYYVVMDPMGQTSSVSSQLGCEVSWVNNQRRSTINEAPVPCGCD